MIHLDLPIRLAIITTEKIRVSSHQAAFLELQKCAARYRGRYGYLEIGQVEGVQLARQLFRELGIEPTKHRPASEALLRRALKDLSFYSINNLVDVCNFCALDFLLPNGVYDRRKLKGDIVLRRGRPCEEYIGHNGQPIHLAGRYTLVDEIGPFGSPITDSIRAAVTAETDQALIVIYAPLAYPESELTDRLATFCERLVKFCQARIIDKAILTGDKPAE